jgi:DNA-binding response OmpR family regulator
MSHDRPVILLVEADELLGRVVASYLGHDGYFVVRGDSLTAAREWAADGGESSADLFVVDLDSLDAGEPETRLADLRSLPVLLLVSDGVSSRLARLLRPVQAVWHP